MIFYPVMIFYLLTLLVCGLYVLLIAIYLTGWNKTSSVYSEPRYIGLETTVSIIIPARNEEKNIVKCLAAINNQSYPQQKFEIIVVDDHSSDGTHAAVKNLHIQNLKFISLGENKHGKKQAITSGISHSNCNLIITTDADCVMGENWLSSVVSFYERNKAKMIIGPVLLKGERGFLEGMQAQEMMALTASACGSLYYNIPVLCSGANLAYERDAFTSVNGFDGANTRSTGDDVFLMLKVQDKFPGSIRYLKSKEAVVYTHPETKIISTLNQRQRWASKTFLYNELKIIAIAVLVFFTNFLILVSGLLSVINYKFALIFVIAFLAKYIIDFMFLFTSFSFFGKRINPILFIIASLIYPLYVTVIGLVSPFLSYHWKGRKS